MIIACTNVKTNVESDLSRAWQTKVEQAYKKAELVIQDKKEFSKVKKVYDDFFENLSKDKAKTKWKRAGNALMDLFPVLPHIFIIMAWLCSVVILLPQCRVNLDSSGTNGYQLAFIADFIVGAIILPYLLRGRYDLPRVIASLGVCLSIILIIPRLDENLDSAGTNAFHLLLLVEFICIIVITIRTLKRKKNSDTTANNRSTKRVHINVAGGILSLICIVLLLTAYGLSRFSIRDELNKAVGGVSATKYDNESTKYVNLGTYTYKIRNYVGMNLASVGEMWGDFLVDGYGAGKVRIVIVTEDHEIISPDLDEQKKKYKVVAQNIKPGTDITVVHQRDSSGKPYSNLEDYKSYDEIILYVEPITSSGYVPDYKAILPTLDRHEYHIRDYIGRNAASFGKNFGDDRVDEYGDARLKVIFTAENGEYIEPINTDALKQYYVIAQDIPENTELKLIYETDSRGTEYDTLIQSQNYEEINLTVRKIT